MKQFNKTTVFVPCNDRQEGDDLSRVFPRIRLIAIIRYFHDFDHLREAIDLVDQYWDLESRNRATTYEWRRRADRDVRGICLTFITDDTGLGRLARAVHGRFPQMEMEIEKIEDLGYNTFAAAWTEVPS